ncbi:claudin-34 isoform X1 [Panthera tigris]|uniref:claudin-34 isoform X1 n=2 Tax=Panthera tigris TaxID=9694 RepID=UPI001C6F7823|nr:claudin-34 isoform X1 [Panthera tigris]XP_042830240.1 claudin-34 isoform X1 [Panthera tigris]
MLERRWRNWSLHALLVGRQNDPQYAVSMALPLGANSCQTAGFTLATIGWILTITSMGLVEWRVWHIGNTSLSYSGVVCVGMWKVCIYHHVPNTNRSALCYHYAYNDTYIPLDIRICQNLLLVASILGLMGRVSIIFALKNLCVGSGQRNVTFSPLVVSGILDIAAGICILIPVIWNYRSVMNEEGIAFPPFLSIPFKPNTQELGSAILVAGLSAIMMLSSGLIFLFYRCPIACRVHPQTSEI